MEAQKITWGPAGPVNTAGRSRNMIVDKADQNTLYLGSSTSGLFKSTDAGANWAPLDDQGPVKNISYIAQSADGSLYAATGEGFLRYSQKAKSQVGTGLYKLSGTSLVQVASAAVTGTVINRIACSPSNAARIALATNLGILISNDGGSTFALAQGIPTSTNIVGMDVKFDNSGKLYCSAGNERGHPPFNTVRSKVYRSTDANLSSFQDITPYSYVLPDSLYGRIELAVAPTNNNIIYASVANKNTSTPASAVANSASLKALFVSDNGGDAWGLILQGSPQLDPFSNGGTISTGDYAQVLTVSPGDADMLFVGGYQTYFFKRDRSKGSASFPVGTWTKIGSSSLIGMPLFLHQNVHDIKIIPGNPIKFYFITDAGVYRSIDLATAGDFVPPSFQRFYKGLITGQFNSVSIQRYPATAKPIKDSAGFAAKPFSGFIGGTSGNGLTYFSGNNGQVTQETNYIGGEVFNAEFSKILPDAAFATTQNGNMYRSSNVKSSEFVPLNVNLYGGSLTKIAPNPTGFSNLNITAGTPFRLWENYGTMKKSPDSAFFYNDTLRFQASIQGVSTLTTQTTFTFSTARPNKFALIDSIVIRTATVQLPTSPSQITVPFTSGDKKDILLKLANNYTVGAGKTVPPVTTSVGPVAKASVTLDPGTLLDNISVQFATPPFETKTLSTVSGGGDAASYYRVFATVFYKYKAGDSVTIVDNNISTKTTSYTAVLPKALSWAYGSNPSFVIAANVNTSIPSSTYILNPGGVSQASPQFTVSPFTTTTYTISQRGTYTLSAIPVVYTITAVTSSAMPTPTYVLNPGNVIQSTPDFTVNPVASTGYTITELSSAEETQSVITTAYLGNPGGFTTAVAYVTPTVNTTFTMQAISTNTLIGASTSTTYATLAANTTTTVGSGTRPESPYNPLVKVPTYYSARLAIALQHSGLTAGGDAIVVAKNPLSLNDPLNFVRVSQNGAYTDDATGKPTFNSGTVSGKPTVIEWSKSGTELYYATNANKLYRVSHITDIMDLSPSSFSGKFYTDVFRYSDPPVASVASLNPESPYRTTEIGSFTKPVSSISVSNDDKTLVITFNEPTTTGTVVMVNSNDARLSNATNIGWVNKTSGFPADMGQVYCSLIEKEDQKQVFLGTDIGVLHTSDITANPPTWTNIHNNQLPRVQIFDIDQQTIEPWGSYNSGAIYVATNGRGVWSTDAFFTPYVVSVEEFEKRSVTGNNLTLFPNPATSEVTVRFNAVQGEDATISVMDINGRLVYNDNLGVLNGEQVDYRFETGSLQAGLYIVNISSNAGVKRVTKLVVTK